MSKNRDRRPTGKSPEVLPGGEARDDGVGEGDNTDQIMDKVFEEDVRKNFMPQVADVLLGVNDGKRTASGQELKSSEKNRLQRAEMHLSFLIQEITALANEGALVGVFRRACAEAGVVFNDSNAALWQPLKSVKVVLEKIKDKA